MAEQTQVNIQDLIILGEKHQVNAILHDDEKMAKVAGAMANYSSAIKLAIECLQQDLAYKLIATAPPEQLASLRSDIITLDTLWDRMRKYQNEQEAKEQKKKEETKKSSPNYSSV